MKRTVFGSLIAAMAIVVLFFVIHSVRKDDGRALASVNNVVAKAIENDGAEHSSAQKRSLRRVVMADSQNIMTLNGEDIRAVFRQPELVRRDLPTVVWQYRNDGCVLDVYFTSARDEVSEAPVAHYEVRARRGNATDKAAVHKHCVEQLVREHAGSKIVKLDAFYKAK